MEIYRPKLYRPKLVGGSLGGVYRQVVKKAKKIIDSPLGKKLQADTKKKILQAGSSAIEKVLSGITPLNSIKSTVKHLNTSLSLKKRKRFKNSVIKKKKRKKRKKGFKTKKRGGDGILLYKLKKGGGNKKRKKRRKKRKNISKAPILYKLNKRYKKKKKILKKIGEKGF